MALFPFGSVCLDLGITVSSNLMSSLVSLAAAPLTPCILPAIFLVIRLALSGLVASLCLWFRPLDPHGYRAAAFAEMEVCCEVSSELPLAVPPPNPPTHPAIFRVMQLSSWGLILLLSLWFRSLDPDG